MDANTVFELPRRGYALDACLEGADWGIGMDLAECTRMQKGRFGEDVTAKFVEKCGLTIIERNWRCSFGEVDIIAEDGDAIVLIEVKTRFIGRRGDHIMPEQGVGPQKRSRYEKLALVYLSTETQRSSVRFDVAAVGIVDKGCTWMHYLTGAYEWDD